MPLMGARVAISLCAWVAVLGAERHAAAPGVPDPHTVKRCDKSCRQLKQAMVDAIGRDDINAVTALLDGGQYELSWLDDEDGLHHTQGHLPLHRAAHHAHQHIAELLLSRGANINGGDKHGETALHKVAQNIVRMERHSDGEDHEMKHGELAEYLLTEGAAANAVDEGYGWSPLHWCAYAGHLEVAEMLVKYGANVNLQDASKATPLHLAATKGHTEMASFLLNKGARTDVDNMRRKNPSEVAAKEGHTTLATMLDPALDPNCDASYRTKTTGVGDTPFHPRRPSQKAPPKPPASKPPHTVQYPPRFYKTQALSLEQHTARKKAELEEKAKQDL